MTVGETPFTHEASELDKYVLPANDELNMVFHFELMDLDSPSVNGNVVSLIKKDWRLPELRAIIGRWQSYKRDEGFWNASVCIFIIICYLMLSPVRPLESSSRITIIHEPSLIHCRQA